MISINTNNSPPDRSAAVYWILGSDGCFASSRLQGLLIHRQLQRSGVSSHVLYAPPRWSANRLIAAEPITEHVRFAPGDICVVQKVDGPEIQEVVAMLRRQGVVVVYVECDYRSGVRVADRCDAVVCASEALCERLQADGCKAKMQYIADPVESIRQPQLGSRNHCYNVVWVGNQSNWSSLAPARDILSEPEFADLSLVTVSDHPEATHRWSQHTVFNHWAAADVCIVPTSTDPAAQCKSNNRVTQAMALGLAVVCGDIPAYRELVEHGKTGMICRTADDYRSAFAQLRDPNYREQMRRAGHQWVRDRYRVEQVTARWHSLFLELSPTYCETAVQPSWWQRTRTAIGVRRCRAELLALLVKQGVPSVTDGLRCLEGSMRQWPFQAQLPWHTVRKGLARATSPSRKP